MKQLQVDDRQVATRLSGPPHLDLDLDLGLPPLTGLLAPLHSRPSALLDHRAHQSAQAVA